MIPSRPTAFTVIAFTAILFLGLFVRVDDFRAWKKSPDICFFDGNPLLGAFDGYYYLRLARDLLDDTYEPKDILRYRSRPGNSPRPFMRPSPPPLISVLAATTSKITGLSLDWVGVFLPVFLGVLLAFPVYGIGRDIGGCSMGLVAACMSLLSPYYVYRSGMGWFDTGIHSRTDPR